MKRPLAFSMVDPIQVSRYEVFSGPYFPVFGLNTGKHGPEKTQYLDKFHAVMFYLFNKF